jgi:RNase adapter protein RapZ
MALQRFIIVSGMSGAGKTVALHALEDAGFYCVDNLPVGFLANFANFVSSSALPLYQKVAVGIDARNPDSDLKQLPMILDGLHTAQLAVEVIFIEASDEALIKRYSETRRRHPLSTADVPLRQAIAQERAILEPIIVRADLRIDTTHTHIHQFRSLIHQRITQRQSGTLALQVISFGYKNGVPPDADFVFDVRCLPNPYWDPHLRQLSGKDEAVRVFLDSTAYAAEMLADIGTFLERWIPRFQQEDRSYLTIAVGCTGGRHRSVYIVERLALRFREQWQVVLTHRDV